MQCGAFFFMLYFNLTSAVFAELACTVAPNLYAPSTILLSWQICTSRFISLDLNLLYFWLNGDFLTFVLSTFLDFLGQHQFQWSNISEGRYEPKRVFNFFIFVWRFFDSIHFTLLPKAYYNVCSLSQEVLVLHNAQILLCNPCTFHSKASMFQSKILLCHLF